MAIRSWDLIDLQQLKDELQSGPGTGENPRLEGCIMRTTDMIDSYTRRRLITRGTNIVEFHSVPDGLLELYPLDYPVINVVSLHEDPQLLYGASMLLDPTTYVVQPGDAEGRSRAKIQRLWGWSWLCGYRYQRLEYRGGFADRAAVPYSIKHVALELAAIMYRQIERKLQGEVQRTEIGGAVTRYQSGRYISGAHLDESMCEQLQPWVREDYIPTGERA